MRFEYVQYTFLFILIPLTIVFFIWSGRKRRRDLEQIGSSPLLQKLVANYRPFEARLRAVLMVLSLLFFVIALTGPEWGFHWEKVTHRGIDIVVAIDASRSMLAEDIRPSRLERTRLAVEDIINQLEGDRVGLVTFAGTSFLQVPLTVDYNAFVQGVDSLTPNIMPQGGTDIGGAMQNALKAFDNVEAQNKVMLLFTDGENHEGDPVAVAKQLKAAGVQLIIIGTGTTAGELIPVMQDGHREFWKDAQGKVVKSSLDEKLLKDMASAANGVYLPATDTASLATIYDQFIGKLKKGEINTARKKNFHERYQIFLLIGIILLSSEMLVGMKRRVDS